jgi:tRNA A58 N-methylase Trm61
MAGLVGLVATEMPRMKERAVEVEEAQTKHQHQALAHLAVLVL